MDCNGASKPENVETLTCTVASPDGRGNCDSPEKIKGIDTGYQPDKDNIACQCDNDNYWFKDPRKGDKYLGCSRKLN